MAAPDDFAVTLYPTIKPNYTGMSLFAIKMIQSMDQELKSPSDQISFLPSSTHGMTLEMLGAI